MPSLHLFIGFLLAFGWVANAADQKTCEYQCGDGKCISAFWLCDNVKDCADGSDELGCNLLHSCNKDEFMCRNGECIKANLKCDGKMDCSDESDERACSSKMEDIALPSAGDFEHDMAHHVVKPTQIVVTKPEQSNRPAAVSSCPQQNASLFFTSDGSSVYRLRINGTSQQPEMIVDNVGTREPITSLTHNDNKLLFVTKRTNNHIYAIDGERKVSTFVQHDSEHFERIVADPLTNNVYFTEDGFGIGVCDKNADKCVNLIEDSSRDHKFSNLILHPRRGSMFWIEHEPKPVVKVSGMDGKKSRHIGVFDQVHSIAMDPENELLFVADENAIFTVDLRNLTQANFAPVRAKEMVYFNCQLYYVQRDLSTLRVLINGHEDKQISPLSDPNFVFTLVADDSKAGLPLENPCSRESCSEVCALTESSIEPEARCVCKVCTDFVVIEAESSAFSVFITVVLILLLLTLIGMFLVIYFRLWPALCDRLDHLLGLNNAHNTSNISVGFNNSEFK